MIENIIQWAEKCLLEKGYLINDSPEEIQKTPYSRVIRFSTSGGYFYLKKTPQELFLEPAIMQILSEKFQANVPIIIALNKELNCFLMKDVGNPLRNYLKIHFKPELLYRGVEDFTHIQRATQNHINIFLELGMPDWRLEKLPFLYLQLIDQKDLLIQDGMTINELEFLTELIPIVSEMCELLSRDKIPETLAHCDFHDNNILIEKDSKKITIIDWGETVITHPFFPLISFISTSANRYHLKETDPIFMTFLDSFFKNWLKFHTKQHLLESMRLAKKLWPIYSALGYYRLMSSSNINADSEKLNAYFNTGRNAGRLAKYFKEFIKISAGLASNDTCRVNLADSARSIQEF
jgi:hypothetical protein